MLEPYGANLSQGAWKYLVTRNVSYLFLCTRMQHKQYCSCSFRWCLYDVPGTSSLVRCLVQIGVTLVARNSIFRPHCRDPVAQAKYKLGPADQGCPLYLLNLQLRNSIMKDGRFFFFLFYLVDRSENATLRQQ